MSNPYDILGVKKTATQAEIKLAYRQLAKKHHPDLNNQDPEKIQIFQKVNLAYEVLSDEQLRQKYDAGLIDALGREIQKKYKSHDQSQENNSFDAKAFYEAIKRELAKRKREKAASFEMPKDHNFTLKLTFLDAVKGCQKALNVNGIKETFSIPAGVIDGQTLCFKGFGQGSGKSGKVNIKILVADHEIFKRDENNIILNFPITLKEAISGGVLDIPTIYDVVPIRIAPNIKSGTLLKLKAKGILDPKTQQTGDQLTYIHIALPDQISSEFKTTIEALEDRYPYNPRKSGYSKLT